MSKTVFDVQKRTGEIFRLHGTAPPQPQFGEDARGYRARIIGLAQTLLPRGHVWAGVSIHRQPERALDSIEDAVIHDRVRAFKRPTGPLREVTESCPRTGRMTTKFYGDPEDCWGRYKGVRQRVTGFTQDGRGANSPHARAVAAQRAAVLKAAGLA
jgi:hypothetical protein